MLGHWREIMIAWKRSLNELTSTLLEGWYWLDCARRHGEEETGKKVVWRGVTVKGEGLTHTLSYSYWSINWKVLVWILLGVTKVLPQVNTFYGLVTKHILTSEWWELLSRITWLIDNWPINWLTDSLSVAKRLMDWLTEYYWLCNWLANDHLFSWLTRSLPVWLTVWLTVWETVWVTHWLVDWPTDYLYDCLTDWLNKCLSGCFIAFLVVPLQGILSILTVSFFPKVNIFR